MALSPPVSLLLLARLPGTGGARPGGAGGRPIAGIGGAPVTAGALSLTLPTMGAERSLTTPTFFSCMPLPMSDSSAPCDELASGQQQATAATYTSSA